MPTSAVVSAVDEFPSLRLRHNREHISNDSQTGSPRSSHPLSAKYYDMSSSTDDRYGNCCMLSVSFTDLCLSVIPETWSLYVLEFKLGPIHCGLC